MVRWIFLFFATAVLSYICTGILMLFKLNTSYGLIIFNLAWVLFVVCILIQAAQKIGK